MAIDPSMPFYVNDWLSSTAVSCMSLAEQGAYVRLLCHCWASQDASLPADDRSLASLSGLGSEWIVGDGNPIRDQFIEHPKLTGRITNRKVYELWLERQAWRQRCREGGRESAKKRAKTRQEMCGTENIGESKGSSTTLEAPLPTVLVTPLQVEGQVTPQVKGNSSSSSSTNIFSDQKQNESDIADLIFQSLTGVISTTESYERAVQSLPRRMHGGKKAGFIEFLHAVQRTMDRLQCGMAVAEQHIISRNRLFSTSYKATSQSDLCLLKGWFEGDRFDDDEATWEKPPDMRSRDQDSSPPKVRPLQLPQRASRQA